MTTEEKLKALGELTAQMAMSVSNVVSFLKDKFPESSETYNEAILASLTRANEIRDIINSD